MEQDDLAELAKATISYSDFISNREKGTYTQNLRVIINHNEGSIKIPENQLLNGLLRAAALSGGYSGNISCHTLNFVSENRKNCKKLVIYCKTSEIANKIIDLKEFSLGGHTVTISDDTGLDKKAKTAIKKIDVSGVHAETLEALVDYLRDFAEFENEDITISAAQLHISITVKNFKKIIPQKRVFSKGNRNHTVFIKTTGYGDVEVQEALKDKPLMADLFKKNSNQSSNKTESWLGDDKRVIPASRASRVLICNYCTTPGHTRYDKDRNVVCPELKKYLSSLKCFKCGEKGHKASFCTRKDIPEGERKCFKCNEVGHEQWEKNKCKKYKEGVSRRRTTFNQKTIEISDDSDTSDSESEKISIKDPNENLNGNMGHDPADQSSRHEEEVGVKPGEGEEQSKKDSFDSPPPGNEVKPVELDKGKPKEIIKKFSGSKSTAVVPVSTTSEAIGDDLHLVKTSDRSSQKMLQKLRSSNRSLSRENSQASREDIILGKRPGLVKVKSKSNLLVKENEHKKK